MFLLIAEKTTQTSRILTILLNGRSGQINSQKLMLRQQKTYIYYFIRAEPFSKNIQLSECRVSQLNILMSFL